MLKKITRVAFLLSIAFLVLKIDFKKEKVKDISNVEQIFHDDIAKKRKDLLIKQHNQKVDLISFLIDKWPEGLYIKEVDFSQDKVLIKGTSYNYEAIQDLMEMQNHSIVVQSLEAQKNKWDYICAVWYT